MKYVKFAGALMLAVLLLLFPLPALDAAKGALANWANAYVPAMLPFFMILPVLSSPQAAALYERIFGRLMRLLFGCPGRAAGAIVLSLMAGSPAGSLALARLANGSGMNRGELSRAALLCTGLSPLFLMSAIGAGMLGSVEQGALLASSQLGALLITGLVARFCWRGDTSPLRPVQLDPPGTAVSGAALNLLCVGMYMAMFCVLARLICTLLGARFETPMLALLEVTGGCASLVGESLTSQVRLVLMAGISGASGLSILMQNLARLRPLGLPWHRLVLGKLAQGLTSMLLCGLQVRIWSHPFAPSRNEVPAFIWAFALAAIALALVGVGITLIPPADAHKQ